MIEKIYKIILRKKRRRKKLIQHYNTTIIRSEQARLWLIYYKEGKSPGPLKDIVVDMKRIKHLFK